MKIYIVQLSTRTFNAVFSLVQLKYPLGVVKLCIVNSWFQLWWWIILNTSN